MVKILKKESYGENRTPLSHRDYVTNAINSVIDNLQGVVNVSSFINDGEIDVLRIINCQVTLEQLVYDLAFFKN